MPPRSAPTLTHSIQLASWSRRAMASRACMLAMTSAVVLTGTLVGLAGCDASSHASASSSNSAIAPEHISPTALVQRFNEIATVQPQINPASLATLYAPETTLQRRYLALLDAMVETQRFEQAMWAAFGETLEGPADAGPLSAIQQHARVTSVRDDSAIAEYVDAHGARRTLALIRNDQGEWRISGRSLEANARVRFSHESLSQLARRYRYLSPAARPLRAKILTGEFGSADAVRAALSEALAQQSPHLADIDALIKSPVSADVITAPGTNVMARQVGADEARR